MWEIGTPVLTGIIMGMLVMIPYLFCAYKISNILDYQKIIAGWVFLIVLYVFIHFLVVIIMRKDVKRSMSD